jgi:hypothetical protein
MLPAIRVGCAAAPQDGCEPHALLEVAAAASPKSDPNSQRHNARDVFRFVRSVATRGH